MLKKYVTFDNKMVEIFTKSFTVPHSLWLHLSGEITDLHPWAAQVEPVNWKIKAQLLSLSPTHFVNNIRLQHRCEFFKVLIIVAWMTKLAVSDPERYWNHLVAFLWFMSDHSISMTCREIMFLTESKRFKVLVLVMRANLENLSSLGFSFWLQV